MECDVRDAAGTFEVGGGGVRIFWTGGGRKKGVRPKPPNPPPWLRACMNVFIVFADDHRITLDEIYMEFS